ncbi:hypothetical protein N7493_003068 [Penicillium malachiteum]|uniref:Uncharacterized protein n=1 Tax=Penicillium malachiteum TaxID=1324776 RepID=A0AAD6HTS8_9EURO|nr:hypothetical protein N7493_003068 [Penicillium malachiteum]
MSLPNSPPGNTGRPTWQDRLSDVTNWLLRSSILSPIGEFRQLTADADCPYFGNAGGRTAWSSTVTVSNRNVAARYWYDGQYINNAKEDAAEVALQVLNQQPQGSTIYPGQLFPQATSGNGRGVAGR